MRLLSQAVRGEIWVGLWEEFLHIKVIRQWNGLSRGVGEVTVPGCGTQCHDLGDRVVFGHRMDLMISEAFYKLMDSVILSKLHK